MNSIIRVRRTNLPAFFITSLPKRLSGKNFQKVNGIVVPIGLEPEIDHRRFKKDFQETSSVLNVGFIFSTNLSNDFIFFYFLRFNMTDFYSQIASLLGND